MNYVIYNPAKEKYYTGHTIKDAILSLCKIRFVNRQLFVKCDGYLEHLYHTYNDEYTDEEMRTDAIKFLVNKIQSDYRCKIFKRY